MEANEMRLDPEQSLRLITATIAKTRDNIRAMSDCFLLWGWLIAGASFAFYGLHAFTDTTLYFLPFPLVVLAGGIWTIRFFRRMKAGTETWLNWFLKQLWATIGVCFLLVVAMSVVKHQLPFTYTLLLGGLGTLVSGLVMRFRPLIGGGILFLLLACCSVVVSDAIKPLLQGVAVMGGYLIPGYLLKYSKTA
ncbi:hypothetical protein SAMN05444266_10856 [Chitinophaga jiangningensis]|uniref:Uncharacterized protein n=1 Tax=Chitinophaga jiangningensis TaxID=1419482 RepID=A0A1M7IQX0_9BACT|nr:hypothetical protein [Chitinophaga jiangningensis]SHM42988.1 hypothetical protein SAMN05444266_10856 [Chitinophaga jiangningensis]